MGFIEIWACALTALFGGLGWLVKRLVDKIDSLDLRVNAQEVNIQVVREVTRTEVSLLREDIKELKILLRDISRKLDERGNK